MKTNRLHLVSLALASALAAAAAEPAKRPCCASETCPATTTTPATLSARSLYQLDAAWTNDAGATVKLATLRGRPVVLAMFFANCEYACPMLVADMRRMRESLPAEVRAKTQFVLVSFDSVRDTAAALKTYRDTRGLDASWTLLHGDPNAVQELAMLLGVKFKQDAKGQFSHSNTITVLNSEGEIARQRNGLGGDVSELAGTVMAAVR
jgi:protein SCO1/2